MRVLQINSVCGVGSTGRIATDLHSILKEQGHESYIAYGRGEAKNCENAIKIGNKLDNYFHVAQTRLLDRHGLGSYWATKKFIKQIEKINPDIIHLHNIHGYYINVKVLFNYLKKTNKPIVWTLHDCWAFTGHCTYFDYVGCDKWKNGCNQCIQKKEYPTSLVWDRSKKNYILKKKNFREIKNMTIVTPSKWLASLVSESFLQEHHIQLINNGIDLEIFKPTNSTFRKQYGLENKFIILGVASTWDRRKGINYFIELSRTLKDNQKIVLVGVTEEQKEKLPSNIIGISRTNNAKELAEIYTEANVFVNPTLEDNFPTTNLEALGCGTPVITFKTGGSVESIDRNTGYVINVGDVKELKNSIHRIEIKSKEVDWSNCTDRAKCLYDKRKKYREYIKLYEEQINENRSY